MQLPWLVNLASLVCDVDCWLSCRVSALQSVVIGSTCWWDLIRSKQLSSVSIYRVCLLNFLVMLIQFTIPLLKKKRKIYSYDYNQAFTTESNSSIKYPIRIWYAIKQINLAKPNKTNINMVIIKHLQINQIPVFMVYQLHKELICHEINQTKTNIVIIVI